MSRRVIRNPEFAREIRNVWVPGGSSDKGNFYRGRLESSPYRSSDDIVWQLQFLYNPTDVSFSASASAIAATASASSNSDLTSGQASGNTVGNVSFGLLFDRTFEVNTPGHALHDWGVQADIALLYSMLGMDYNQITAESMNGSSNSSSILDPLQRDKSWIPSYPLAAMRGFVTAIFGHRLTFYGMIDNISITYTHFTQQMVPVRCGINVSMTVLQPDQHDIFSSAIIQAQKEQAKAEDTSRKLRANSTNRYALAKARQVDAATAGGSAPSFYSGSSTTTANGLWKLS